MNTEPIKRTKDEVTESIVESHPAFVSVNLSKRQGYTGPLFGSAVKHQYTTVALTISSAKRHHSHGIDRYFAGQKSIIEIEMTESQFAQFVTTWNRGEGIPATMRYLNGAAVPRIPEEKVEHERAMESFKENTKDKIEEFKESHKKLQTILNKKNIGKNDREEINELFLKVDRWLTDGAPYMVETFHEVAERTIAKAKIEIDAFAKSIVMKSGELALQNAKLLTTVECNNCGTTEGVQEMESPYNKERVNLCSDCYKNISQKCWSPTEENHETE